MNERASDSPGSAVHPPSLSADAEPPPELPDFEILKLVGEGTFGRVWLGKERVTGVYRAIKTFPTAARDTEIAGLSEFQRRSLQHPNLIQIFVVGQFNGSYFVVMELADDIKGSTALDPQYYETCNLERLILDRGALPPEQAINNIRGILEGTAYLHNQGLIHRDIKPSNVLFVNGTVKLSDFGLVAPGHQAVDRAGTHGYWRPDGPTDRDSDLYAVTKVAYEMFTGADVAKFSELPSELARVSSPNAYQGIKAFLEQGCAENRARRFHSAQAMQEGLDAVADAFGVEKHRAEPRGPRRTPFGGWSGLIAISIVTIALGIGAFFVQPFSQTRFAPLAKLNVTTFPADIGHPNVLSREDPQGLLPKMSHEISTANLDQRAPVHAVRYAKIQVLSNPSSYMLTFWISPSGFVYTRPSQGERGKFNDPQMGAFRSLDGFDGNYVICVFLSDDPFRESEVLLENIERLATESVRTALPAGTIRVLSANQTTPVLVGSGENQDDTMAEGFGLLGQIRSHYGHRYPIIGVELPLPTKQVMPTDEDGESGPPPADNRQEETPADSDNP